MVPAGLPAPRRPGAALPRRTRPGPAPRAGGLPAARARPPPRRVRAPPRLVRHRGLDPGRRPGGHRVIAPLLNRFVHLDLEVAADDWQEWAAAAGIAPEVRAFLRFRPALLFRFDPAAEARAFATPRSWHFVSDVLARTPEELVGAVVAGCVGEGPAAEFSAFRRLYRELPDVGAVLAHPETAPVPQGPAVLYALVGALVEACRGDGAPLDAFVRYATRLPDEFALLALRDALAIRPALAALPAVQAWIARARALGYFPAT